MFWAVMTLGVVFFALVFLVAAFSSSLTAGLVMSGAYVLFLLVATVAYRLYKKAYDWEQGAPMRELKAAYLATDPKPCYLNEQKRTLAGLASIQRDREIAALTTRTWRN